MATLTPSIQSRTVLGRMQALGQLIAMSTCGEESGESREMSISALRTAAYMVFFPSLITADVGIFSPPGKDSELPQSAT